MSLLIEKHNGEALMHATSTRHEDINEMRQGVLPDTLFHSTLPYLTIDGEYTSGDARFSNNTVFTQSLGGRPPQQKLTITGQLYLYDFPQALIDDLAAGHMFLVFGETDDGTYISTNADALGLEASCGYSYFTFTTAYVRNGQTDSSFHGPGIYFSSIANPADASAFQNGCAGFMANTTSVGQTSLTANYRANSHSYLNKNSKSALYFRAYNDPADGTQDYSYTGPMIRRFRFFKVNLKHTADSGFIYTPLVSSPESVEIDNSKILINNTDFLSGKKYLVYKGTNKKGNALTPEYPSSKIVPGVLQYPLNFFYNTYTVFSNFMVGRTGRQGVHYRSRAGMGHMAAVRADNTVDCVINDVLSDTDQEFYNITAAQYNTVRSHLEGAAAAYDIPIYEMVDFPNPITSVTMSEDSLVLNNNHVLYGPGVFPVSQVGEYRNIVIPGATRVLSGSGTFEYLEASIDLPKLPTVAHILMSMNGIPNGSGRFDPSPGALVNIYYNWNNNYANVAELSLRLAALKDNDRLFLGSITTSSSITRDSSITYQVDAMTTYTLRRVMGKLELWSSIRAARYGGNSETLIIPPIEFSFALLHGRDV